VSAKLTVCMIVRDEEALLPGALHSVGPIADELIVGVDDRTTDATERIARAAGARIHHFTWCDDFSAARNIGLAKVRKDWVLVIDADERLTPFGAGMVRAVLRQPNTRVDGYCLETSQCTLAGREGRRDISTVRLWPNNPQTRYAGRVYEHPRHHGKMLTGGVLRGAIGLVHYGGDPDIFETRRKTERNQRLFMMDSLKGDTAFCLRQKSAPR